jgi:hypothetical protein
MDRLEDIIWSAGFMEGEGSAGFYKAAGRSSRLCLSATQKDIAPLELLKDLYDGKTINVGTFDKPDEARAALAEAISNEAKLNKKGRLVNA